MSKGLEHLEILEYLVELYGHFSFDFTIIEKELKALEIIKEKICLGGLCSALQETKNFEDYKVSYFTQLTKEEYDLLKEVML